MLYNANSEEQKIQKFWEDNKIFEKSVSERPADKPYVFYDGPPFATGLPHYGHFPSSIMKDAVPRYFTMRGYRVERRWGWDCHGLPIENIVEKEMGTKSKKEIEALGVAEFNERCRSKVLGYVDGWKKTIGRLGRWVDMDNAYRTMDLGYMESVWWVFKQLWDKDLIYEDYRSMHVCPRCETTLSQQEVSEGYKDVKDISLFVRFKLTNAKEKLGLDGDVYMLAWTTTPWTLPGNVALAVGEDVEYSLIKITEAPFYIEDKGQVIDKEGLKEYFVVVANNLKDTVLESPHLKTGSAAEELDKIKGEKLSGLTYEPLFPYYQDTPNAFRVVAGDFVTTEDGTGIVHIAPAFGDDDFKVGKRENIPLVQHVSMDGRFKPEVTDFAGQEVKPRSDDDKIRLAADIAVIKYLQDHELFFAKKNIQHTYPHCWRCDTPLLNYTTSSWFMKVTAIKDRAIELAKQINWSPEHIKEGRFGKWLEGARDWSISRQRFWASVMPVWQCDSCKKYEVFGSVADLEKACGQAVADLHKHVVDTITFACSCGGGMRRIPDVLDTWFDSGSMPYAQVHYPFENKAKFEASFPAQFIAEGQDQTRAWFYYLHILSTALFDSTPFKNVIVNGIVLAEDGKKMSKKLQNYPDPNMLVEKYGADALRYYLLTSPVMHAESLNFSEEGVRELYGKLVNTLWNVYEFYTLFAGEFEHHKPYKSSHLLDKWIMAKLHQTEKEVTKQMETYHLAEAARPLLDFVTELSQWYVRRSRERLKGDDETDKMQALSTLRHVLLIVSKLLAPFTPFIAEKLYSELRSTDPQPKNYKESVHLEAWPAVHDDHYDEHLLQQMELGRAIVEMGLALRAEHKLKVRQPLSALQINNDRISHELRQIIAEELNVKEVEFAEVADGPDWKEKKNAEVTVWLNTALTPELKEEGMTREIIRAINQLRKDQGLTANDIIQVVYATADPGLLTLLQAEGPAIAKSVLAKSIATGPAEGVELMIGGKSLKLALKNTNE